MTFQWKLLIVGLMTVVGALVVLGTGRGPRHVNTKGFDADAVWLGVVGGALVVVGIESRSLPTHLVQIAPLFVAAVLCWRRLTWSRSVAAALFAFWLLVMAGIWLFLLGIAPVFTGTFSRAEILLTLVIGIGAVFGLRNANRQSASLPVASRVAAVVGSTILQGLALLLSYQPFVIGR